jgi:hypothetical protein
MTDDIASRALRALAAARVPTALCTVTWNDQATGDHHTTNVRAPRGDREATQAAVAARVLGDRDLAHRVAIRTVAEAR